MIDSGASVNVCVPSGSENRLILQEADGSVRLRGADGRTLQDYGKRQIWLKIGKQLRQYDFHVVEVTKLIVSVSYLCENGIETHLTREPFLKCGSILFCNAASLHPIRAKLLRGETEDAHGLSTFFLDLLEKSVGFHHVLNCRLVDPRTLKSCGGTVLWSCHLVSTSSDEHRVIDMSSVCCNHGTF